MTNTLFDVIEPSTLTKVDIVQTLIEQNGLSKREAKHLVELFFEEICLSLLSGKEVKLSGFGTFEVRQKPPRPGRNPRTGLLVPIEARKVVNFLPSLKLKQKVNDEL
jgi:integration host factor subunit alpha